MYNPPHFKNAELSSQYMSNLPLK